MSATIPPEERHNYVTRLIHRDEWKLICQMRQAAICARKVRYETHSEALGEVIRLGSRLEDPMHLKVYECQICGKFHLSRNREKQPKPE